MKKTIVVFVLLFCWIPLFAQQFDVFYLSIGSAQYEQNDDKIKEGCTPYADINGARRSARYVKELFTEKANGKGIMLRSEPGKLLSRNEILNAIEELVLMAKGSNKPNPLLVFYFCGHGVSEGFGWSQFLVPGDFTEKPTDSVLNSDPQAINIGELADKLVYLGEITDALFDSGLPYVCLIDACYQGKLENFSDLGIRQNLNPEFISLMKETGKIIRFMNEYRQANPVVFSTSPGTTIKVVSDPFVNEGVAIGPLCRKIMLVAQKVEDIGNLTLMDFIYLITDTTIDPQTSSVISNYEFNEKGMDILLINN